MHHLRVHAVQGVQAQNNPCRAGKISQTFGNLYFGNPVGAALPGLVESTVRSPGDFLTNLANFATNASIGGATGGLMKTSLSTGTKTGLSFSTPLILGTGTDEVMNPEE